MRIGEASHPGPPFAVRSANVTSLMPHLPYIASFECDAIALQEVRLTTDGQKILSNELLKLGWTPFWGKPQPIRSGTVKSVLDAKQGGVGILIRQKHQGGPSPRSAVGEELKETGRWFSTVIKLNKSGSLLHLVTVYGFPGANEGGEAAFQNEAFLRKVFDESSTLGDVPVIICGDFNCSLEGSAVLTEMVVSGKWNDAALLYGTVSESAVETTYTAFGGSSRIDMIFMNTSATRLFSECKVIPVPEEGIKRHKPVEAKFNFEVQREYAEAIPSIRALPQGTNKLEARDLDDLEGFILREYLSSFQKAYEEKNTDVMWKVWTHMAERFLITKAAAETKNEAIIHDARYVGRGLNTSPKRVRVGRAPDSRNGIGVDPERRELNKLVNILDELLGMMPDGNRANIRSLWEKAQRLGRNCLKTHPLNKHWYEQDVPSLDGLISIKQQVDKVLIKVTFGDRDRLLRKWMRDRAQRLKDGIGDLAKHFRPPDQAPLTIIKLPDGRITGNVREMDNELRRCWLPIFAKHTHGGEPVPDAERFLNKYREFIPRKTQTLKDISLEDLLHVQKKLKAKGAGGLDGWRPSEVKAIPAKILHLLSKFFEVVESNGEWPAPLCTAGVTLIPKGDGGAPLDQRPITVTSIIYRMWAAIRMRHSTDWQDSWMSGSQHGARAKHSTVNALARISMHLERAILQDKPIYGITFDLSKAFDNVPIGITFAICKAIGMDVRLYTALKGMYERMTRRFKIGKFVGESFKDTNGILQGCPLSVMLLNILMAVLSNILTPLVANESFVDDLTVLSECKHKLQTAANLIREFNQDTGQKVNLKKTYSFGPKGGADIWYEGSLIPKKTEVKVLGVVWRFDGGRLNLEVDSKKVQEGIETANRIRYSMLPFAIRTILNGSLVMAKIMYGIEVQDLKPGDERRLRTAIGFSVWQKTSKQRSPGLLFTLVTKGHVIDPAQTPHVRRLMAVQRCALHDDGLRELLGELWSQLEHKRRFRTGGFIENLLYSVKRLGTRAEVSESCFVLNVGGVELDAFASTSQQWAHHCREAARLSVWKLIDKERGREGRMQWGLSSGINREHTMSLYNRCAALRQGILRKILLNGVWTQSRRAKMPDSNGDPTCTCGYASETIEHLWWYCPRWRIIREQYGCEAITLEGKSCAFKQLGIELLSDDPGPTSEVQRMMIDIFIARFGNEMS